MQHVEICCLWWFSSEVVTRGIPPGLFLSNTGALPGGGPCSVPIWVGLQVTCTHVIELILRLLVRWKVLLLPKGMLPDTFLLNPVLVSRVIT